MIVCSVSFMMKTKEIKGKRKKNVHYNKKQCWVSLSNTSNSANVPSFTIMDSFNFLLDSATLSTCVYYLIYSIQPLRKENKDKINERGNFKNKIYQFQPNKINYYYLELMLSTVWQFHSLQYIMYSSILFAFILLNTSTKSIFLLFK